MPVHFPVWRLDAGSDNFCHSVTRCAALSRARASRRPLARSRHQSYAAAEIPARCLGPPRYFISHAWGSLFVELVEAVAANLEGAAPDETFVWLDIFAINQDDSSGTFSAMAELDDGRTLARVIELSIATKVVLDKERVAPLKRLWCASRQSPSPRARPCTWHCSWL